MSRPATVRFAFCHSRCHTRRAVEPGSFRPMLCPLQSRPELLPPSASGPVRFGSVSIRRRHVCRFAGSAAALPTFHFAASWRHVRVRRGGRSSGPARAFPGSALRRLRHDRFSPACSTRSRRWGLRCWCSAGALVAWRLSAVSRRRPSNHLRGVPGSVFGGWAVALATPVGCYRGAVRFRLSALPIVARALVAW